MVRGENPTTFRGYNEKVSMHKFSIIMPLYNKAPYVSKAIESVLSQTYKDWELIIVDDGSTDDSYSVAQNTLSKSVDGNVTLVTQLNSGVGAARNNGVKLAKNDYFCFLDADDWYETTFLEAMERFISDYPDAGIYATDYFYVKNNRKRVNHKANTGYINYCKVYTESNSMPLWTGAVCLTKSKFDEFNGFPEKIKLGEDFCLWIRIALNYKVAFLNKPLSNYNQDVDVAHRLTRHLHKPEHHMLFNLSELESYEKSNADYKRLMDKLRVNGLMDYWISDEYHDTAAVELKKVDWSSADKNIARRYYVPVWLLKLRMGMLRIGSYIKQRLLMVLYKNICR